MNTKKNPKRFLNPEGGHRLRAQRRLFPGVPGKSVPGRFGIVFFLHARLLDVFGRMLACAVALVHVARRPHIGARRFFPCKFIHYALSPCSWARPTARSL